MKKVLAVLASLPIILMGGVAPASADTVTTTTTTTAVSTTSSPETTAENAEELKVEQEHGRLAMEQVCHTAYEPCLPIKKDIDCGDPEIKAISIQIRVKVLRVDPYRLDRNNNGIACEKGDGATSTSTTTVTTTTPVTTTSKVEVYYANCTEVWLKLKRPLKKGESGYRAGLDTDKSGPDGIACERDPRTSTRAVVPVNNSTSLANTGVSQTSGLLFLGGSLLVVGVALLVGLNLRRRVFKRR